MCTDSPGAASAKDAWAHVDKDRPSGLLDGQASGAMQGHSDGDEGVRLEGRPGSTDLPLEARKQRVGEGVWLTLLVPVLALGLKFGLMLANAFPFNADEAIVALMARHILQGRWPVFFYGQAYMGSLDAILVAGGFKLLGQRPEVIRLLQSLLYAGTIVATMILAARIFRSRWVAAVAGLLMAVPAVNVTLYTTVSIGGYGECLLIGNLLLLTALVLLESPRRGWVYVVWGFLAGLGFWAFDLTLVYIVPTAIALVCAAASDHQGGRAVLRLAGAMLGAAAGASPWLGWALSHGLAVSLYEIGGSAISGASPANVLLAIGTRARNLLLLGSTVIMGLRPPWEARWLAILLLPVAFAFWIGVGIFAVRPFGRKDHLRAGRLLLVGVAGTLLLGFLLTPFGADPSGRYFLPLAAPLAIFAAGMLHALRGRTSRLGIYALLAAVLGFNLWGTVESAWRNPPGITTQFDAVTWIDHRHDPDLIEFLERNGIERGFTNYWVAYPLAFLSEERLIFVPRLPYHQDMRYTARDDRYLPYDQTVAQADHVAYITTNHPALDAQLRTAFSEDGISWREEWIGDYHVYYALSRKVVPQDIGLGVDRP